MATFKVVEVDNGDGTFTHTRVEMTIADVAIQGAMAPLGIMSKSGDYYNKQTVGLMTLGHLSAGVFIGDKYGASIPVLGKRRNSRVGGTHRPGLGRLNLNQ